MDAEAKMARGPFTGRKPAVDIFLSRGIRALLGLLLLSLIGFSVFYYFDRQGIGGTPLVDQTIKDLEDLIRQDPNNPELRVQVAVAYVQRQWYDPAITQFQAALEIEPHHQTALIGLGNVYLAQKDDAAARPLFEKVIELNQDNPFRKTLRQLEGVYYRLSLIQYRGGDLAAAEANLLEALEMDHTDADAWYLLGEVRGQQQQDHQALEAYQKAVNLDPRFADAYAAMAATFTRMGKPELADYAHGMVAIAGGDYGRALPLLERATAASPRNADAFLGMGQAYEHQGRLAEAVAAYENATRLNPDYFLAQMFLQRAQDKQQAAEGRR